MQKHWVKKGMSVMVLSGLVLGMVSCKSEAKQTKSDSSQPLKFSAMCISWGTEPPKNGVYEQDFEKRTNSEIDITWVPYQSYSDKANLLMASNNVPDVMQVMAQNGNVFYPQVVRAVKQGIFQDLTPYLKTDGFIKKNAVMKNWPQIVWNSCSLNGKIYAMPRQSQPVASNSGVIVRKDIMQKAGITKEPTTMDELGDYIIQMSKAGNMYGLQFSRPDFDSTDVKAFAVAFTGVQDWGVDSKGNFTYQSFMPEYDNFLTWMKKLYDAKAIDPEFTLNQSDNSDFVKGKSAVKMNTWWNWDQSADGVSKKFFNASVTNDARVWCLLPPKGPKAYAVSITPGFLQYPLLVSSKVSKSNMTRLMDILNGHTDNDFQTFLMYGYANQDYTLTNGKYMVSADQQKHKTANAVGSWYMLFLESDPDYIATKFVNANASSENIARVKEVASAADKDYKQDKLDLPQLGIDSTTYDNKWSTLTTSLNDYKAKVVMGKISLAQWDAYVKSITSSSDYQAIQKEYKTAYTAAKKTESK